MDINPQPNYPFEFWQDDALEALHDCQDFDAVHASPPCQAYTTMNNRHASTSPPLIAVTRDLLLATGLPYVIENVAGARSELRSPYRLTGEMFGLRVHRPRLFETNWTMLVPWPPPRQQNPEAVYGKLDGRRLWTRTDGTELRASSSLEVASAAMGIDWMTWDELRESIPPHYTQFIGMQLMQVIRQEAAA